MTPHPSNRRGQVRISASWQNLAIGLPQGTVRGMAFVPAVEHLPHRQALPVQGAADRVRCLPDDHAARIKLLAGIPLVQAPALL